MTDSSASRVESLYIHVPFCAQKCAYCAFFSEAASGELVNRYVAALVRELEIVAGDLKPKTVFFGGGTPSILNLRQWETIFRAMEKLNLLGHRKPAREDARPTEFEFTVECNPATVSADKAKLLRDFGVNRVSMGVQSLDEALLDRLGRIHSREQVFKSFDILRHAGFDNLNLDLMFAIPGQTMGIWRDTLREAVAMQSEHLSSYEVIYEDDTPLFAQLKAGEIDVDEDLACDMYEELVLRATAAGFRQYEVANFARDDGRRSPTRQIQVLKTTSLPRSDSIACMPPQRELLARRLILRAGAKRDGLRSRRANEKLGEHATLLRTVGKGKPRHRIARGIAAAETRGRDGGVWFADGCWLAVRGIPSRDGFRFAQGMEFGNKPACRTRLGSDIRRTVFNLRKPACDLPTPRRKCFCGRAGQGLRHRYFAANRAMARIPARTETPPQTKYGTAGM